MRYNYPLYDINLDSITVLKSKGIVKDQAEGGGGQNSRPIYIAVYLAILQYISS